MNFGKVPLNWGKSALEFGNWWVGIWELVGMN
ncbi:hypothetical protein M2133_002440 [Parabacteroides sp. PF5-6]|nr:hypothetical protein [Parabacteroides sp. PF5-6]